MNDLIAISVTVNNVKYERAVEARLLLTDFLRYELELTGTRVGCEHGVCGACTILFDGQPVRACLMLAVQTDGHELMTVEGLAPPDAAVEDLHPLQQVFWEAHGLQCGFCTSGILMSMLSFLSEMPSGVQDNPQPSEQAIREALTGNLCRCTGYQHIVDAVKLAAEKMAAE